VLRGAWVAGTDAADGKENASSRCIIAEPTVRVERVNRKPGAFSRAFAVRFWILTGAPGLVEAGRAMNIHHLELFYYVARHQGISEAVRNIPYGIQQPAVSGQVAQLEEYLGVVLFQRRPFALTPAGEKLFAFIEPFFSSLDEVASELQGGTARQMRLGAATVVLREYLPEFFQSIRKKYPQLQISLREGYPAEFERLLLQEELDLAITVLEKKPQAGIRTLSLLEIPLVLLVAKDSPLASAEELWKRDRIQDPLICLPAGEAISRNFQQGLSRLKVDWFPGIQVSSLDLIETYVANGFGIGVSVKMPRTEPSLRVRQLPLPGFAPIVLGAMWRGKVSALLQTFLDELQMRAKRLRL
jgi:DNA-binding transcriptional LysR family regulator